MKPDIHQDEEVGALSDSAFRLFIGLITLADDYGRLRGGITLLAAQVWPYRVEMIEQVEDLLCELTDHDLIQRYEVDGKPYVCLPSWSEHQRIDNAGKPRIPAPDQATRGSSRRVSASGGGSPLERRGEERKGRGEDAREIPDHLAPILQELDHVAHDRNLSVKVSAVVKACEEFADRDLSLEADKFRRYYIEGAGENRKIRNLAEKWREWLSTSPRAVAASKVGGKGKPAGDLSAYAGVEAAR